MKIALLISLTAALGGCVHSPNNQPKSLVDEAQQRMSGFFDSSAQAARDPDYYAITLAMVPIWPDDAATRWLYVEQATAETPNKPYRQRVYKLTQLDEQVISAVYTLKQPERFIGAWKTGRLPELRLNDLERRDGCEVYLQRVGDDWRGSTRGQNCLSDLRGARWASAEVWLNAEGMRSWDRGFNAQGQQVWGAQKGAYEFIRQPTTLTNQP